ncbi:hypothetical protein ADICEAN_01933 [Cesiribacter andamanensis AMV16]|uniref:Uncharacterized protein n=1 Tax=Cesiribacter andamanensis AMV16 TaxID=1279009 RepID=M7NMF2_9BACT|nr:hypothetical protein ADICEAN_01933 [Cesiribacter andamanensis AMV16]
MGWVEQLGCNAEGFYRFCMAPGGSPVMLHNLQHGLPVFGKLLEGPQLLRQFGRAGIGRTCHQSGNAGGHGPGLRTIIGQAGHHQQGAQVGIAQANGAVLVGALRYLLGGELRHQYRNFQHQRPEPAGMFKGGYIKPTFFFPVKFAQVKRGQVAGRIVQEKIF